MLSVGDVIYDMLPTWGPALVGLGTALLLAGVIVRACAGPCTMEAKPRTTTLTDGWSSTTTPAAVQPWMGGAQPTVQPKKGVIRGAASFVYNKVPSPFRGTKGQSTGAEQL